MIYISYFILQTGQATNNEILLNISVQDKQCLFYTYLNKDFNF